MHEEYLSPLGKTPSILSMALFLYMKDGTCTFASLCLYLMLILDLYRGRNKQMTRQTTTNPSNF